MIKEITKEIYEQIMQNQEFSVHFQPIVSLDKERMIGCEALTRAYHNMEPISAEALFNYVRKQNSEHDLDFLCREKSLKEYNKVDHDVMLFLNFEMALLNDYIEHLDCFIAALDQLGIERDSIVIEINEKSGGDDVTLIKFVKHFREQGFLIALDDVGEAFSNWNRIILTKPDIIKIDRNTISGIHNDFYKCEIVRSITELSSRIGAVVIAEGVEEPEDIFSCLSLGITLFQGFYFSRAIDKEEIKTLDLYHSIHQLTHLYRKRAESEIIHKSLSGKNRKLILQRLADQLAGCSDSEYETVIMDFFGYYKEIECIYVIDAAGKQITRTLFNMNVDFKSAHLFSPAKVNDYHIVKPYYYVVMNKRGEVYVSDRYISAATGHFCETYSCIFYSSGEEELILCLDFSVKE